MRLERRKEQRRVRQYSVEITCQACGHANDAQTKFCGMCGLRVERRSGERRLSGLPDSRANAAANAQLPTPETPGRWPATAAPVDVLTPPPEEEMEARRAAETIVHSRPSPSQTTIGGPSFLGLGNDPEPGESGYLLDDDAPSGSGRGLLFLVILALIGGLAYMGYRSGYFSNLQASTNKPAASVAAPRSNPVASPDSNALAPGDPPADVSPSPAPAAPLIDNKDEDKDTNGKDKNKDRGVPSTQAADPSNGAAETTATDNAPTSGTAAKPGKEIAPPAKRKPSAALIQAQNYLQGKGGVRQDCDQGLVFLKAATEKNDPAAAVQMGALYASGHCVQQDRVMAYRWFNSAHELDPANPWIQTNLDQLWAQMSPQERHQISR